jgi:(2Fe-2S) ferredoxin
LHLFVCANRRTDSSLGPGCAEAGDAVYNALKEDVATRAQFADIWVTKTHCLGLCPPRGATVASYPLGRIFTEVHASEARSLLARELDAVEPCEKRA